MLIYIQMVLQKRILHQYVHALLHYYYCNCITVVYILVLYGEEIWDERTNRSVLSMETKKNPNVPDSQQHAENWEVRLGEI